MKTKFILVVLWWFTVIVVSCSLYELSTYLLNQKSDISNLLGMATLVSLVVGLIITGWREIEKLKSVDNDNVKKEK